MLPFGAGEIALVTVVVVGRRERRHAEDRLVVVAYHVEFVGEPRGVEPAADVEIHVGSVQSPDALRACRITQKEVLDLLLANEGERSFQRFEGVAFGRFVVAAPVADARQQCGGGVLRDVELLGRAPRSRLRIPQQSVGLRQVGRRCVRRPRAPCSVRQGRSRNARRRGSPARRRVRCWARRV